MKFLLDQDVYATTARFLEQLGHDVVSVARLGLSRASDEELLSLAQEQGRILVTRDRGFGALVFVQLLGQAFSTSVYSPQRRTQFIVNSAGCWQRIPRRSCPARL